MTVREHEEKPSVFAAIGRVHTPVKRITSQFIVDRSTIPV